MVKKENGLSSSVKLSNNFSTTQVLYVLLLISFFILGYLIAKVQLLEQGRGTQGTLAQAPAQPNQAAGQQQPQGKVNVAKGHLPALGSKDAKVTIVEFSDFQCPFCRSFFKDSFSQIKKEYIDTGKVAFYYRHYPLPFHPSALPAAIASECANEQGKFWELHDKMYNEQDKQGQGTIQFTKDDLKNWASDLGLDTSKFSSCLDSEKYKSEITKDQNDGQSAGVSGTPTFYINGTQLVGAQPFSAFKAQIDAALK